MNRTLTHRIFESDRNLVNMGNPPMAKRPQKQPTPTERIKEPSSSIAVVEHDFTGIPNMHLATARKIEGMLKGFYQAATIVLTRRPYSSKLPYEGDLVRSLDLCQKELSQLAELKKLADAIAKTAEKPRLLESHFERDLCLVLGFKVEIQERSWSTNRLLSRVRDELAIEDFLPDPTLDPRLWRVQRFVTMNRDTRFIPGLRKVLGVERADAPDYGGGKKGKRYSAARKSRERDRLDLLRLA